MPRFDDLTGRRFGKLVALSRLTGVGARNVYWLCQCDCGNTKAIAASSIRSTFPKKKGCGCEQGMTLHGHCPQDQARKHPLYGIWQAMIHRCRNPKSKFYDRYGGRGISVCERWRSFPAFLSDMGEKPSASHSLDRIDNNGNYEPGNCHWATKTEQQNNMSSNKWVKIDGKSMTMAQCCRSYGIKHTTVIGRLQRGWSTEDAFKKPVGSRKIS